MSSPFHTGWKVRARFSHWNDAEEVVIFHGENIVRFNLEPFDRSSLITEPTVSSASAGGEGFLRAMLNAAWDLGLRPDGFNDTRESIASTKAHLEDMRAIAFHKVGAAKP